MGLSGFILRTGKAPEELAVSPDAPLGVLAVCAVPVSVWEGVCTLAPMYTHTRMHTHSLLPGPGVPGFPLLRQPAEKAPRLFAMAGGEH